MDKETERLAKNVKRELRALKAKVDKMKNRTALTAYEKMKSTLN